MKTIPMCWKCVNVILKPNRYNHEIKTMIGCKECRNIKSYNDARIICPLIDPNVSQAK